MSVHYGHDRYSSKRALFYLLWLDFVLTINGLLEGMDLQSSVSAGPVDVYLSTYRLIWSCKYVHDFKL